MDPESGGVPEEVARAVVQETDSPIEQSKVDRERLNQSINQNLAALKGAGEGVSLEKRELRGLGRKPLAHEKRLVEEVRSRYESISDSLVSMLRVSTAEEQKAILRGFTHRAVEIPTRYPSVGFEVDSKTFIIYEGIMERTVQKLLGPSQPEQSAQAPSTPPPAQR